MILLTDNLKTSKTQLAGHQYKNKKAYASFIPEISVSKTAISPVFYASQSYIMNRGSGVPPPDQNQ